MDNKENKKILPGVDAAEKVVLLDFNSDPNVEGPFEIMTQKALDQRIDEAVKLVVNRSIEGLRKEMMAHAAATISNIIPKIVDTVKEQLCEHIEKNFDFKSETVIKEVENYISTLKNAESAELAVRFSKVYKEINLCYKSIEELKKMLEKNTRMEMNPLENQEKIVVMDQLNTNKMEADKGKNIIGCAGISCTNHTSLDMSTSEGRGTREALPSSNLAGAQMMWNNNALASNLNVKFADYTSGSPYEFLEQLSFEYQAYGHYQQLKTFVGSRLEGRAKVWMLLNDFAGWPEFEEGFKREFCGTNYVTYVTSQLYAGTSLNPRSEEAEQVIVRAVVQCREAGLSLPEESIVRLMSKRLGPDVETIADIHGFSKIETLLNYIRRLRQGSTASASERANAANTTSREPNRNGNYRYSNYRGNVNGYQRPPNRYYRPEPRYSQNSNPRPMNQQYVNHNRMGAPQVRMIETHAREDRERSHSPEKAPLAITQGLNQEPPPEDKFRRE
ncbi:unnamed protein product [Nesidiocoris tenuis]|uniref:Uncharacterized protein n=1 Tax=Nesidiocoris tenuis TaxID=355587 RepID=A0A6H5HBI5_9HEMI|nr:unnamed protein product [Nesidiocoris tenuis]